MLSIQSLTVKADRIVCIVRVEPPFPRSTDEALMDRVLEQYPDLPRHACVNDRGVTFSACMDSTSTPHLLEHMVIDRQLEELARASDRLEPSAVNVTGATHWVNGEKGTARIEVGYCDDLVALRCFSECVDYLNSLV